MKNLFERASSYWVRYDRYELKEGKNGVQYVTAAPDAKPEVYNPLENPEQLVLDALNVGLLSMGRKSEEVIRQGVMDFVHKYGLLGLMTALPTTPQFMEYEAVYLPKNQYIREETMPTEKYLELFYPFDKLDLAKKGIESSWNINEDRTMQALALTFNELMPWDMPLWQQMLIGTAIITGLEFVTGCIVNLWLGWNVWDYSNVPLNVFGQICLPYILLWAPISLAGIILDDYLRYWLFKEERPHYCWR